MSCHILIQPRHTFPLLSPPLGKKVHTILRDIWGWEGIREMPQHLLMLLSTSVSNAHHTPQPLPFYHQVTPFFKCPKYSDYVINFDSDFTAMVYHKWNRNTGRLKWNIYKHILWMFFAEHPNDRMLCAAKHNGKHLFERCSL